jgi:hypothetical protein
MSPDAPRSRDHARDATHQVKLTGGGLAELAGGSQATVNSLHHQSVGRLGRGLRVIARAPDGVIEALEWTAGPGWALGVQWHPERMSDDAFARNIFRRLISEAAEAPGLSAAATKTAGGTKLPAGPRKKRTTAKPKATRRAKNAPKKKGKSQRKRNSGRRK